MRIYFTDGTTADYGGAVDTTCNGYYSPAFSVEYPGNRGKRITGFRALITDPLRFGTVQGAFVDNPQV